MNITITGSHQAVYYSVCTRTQRTNNQQGDEKNQNTFLIVDHFYEQTDNRQLNNKLMW